MARAEDYKALEFERPILELERKISQLEANAGARGRNLEHLAILRRMLDRLKVEVYSKLSAFEKVQIARFEQRPQTSDYISYIFDDFVELHGGKVYREDRSTITGVGRIGNRRVMLIGHEKGKTTAEKIQRNFGCPHPEGYRKALQKMELAEKFQIPIVTLVNTPGAYPGVEAEERGQAYAIAINLMRMSQLRTPILSIVIGEGGSGGALGIAVSDRLAILEYAYYSVISPEGCSAILWKTNENKADAAEALRLTAQDLLALGVVEDVLPEPPGGAHRNPEAMAKTVKEYILSTLDKLSGIDGQTLLETRYQRLRRVGVVIEHAVPLAPAAAPGEGAPT
ncbi:MAG: acetyl-CoA carboxylase carboxyltransferase subunit alpha [Planctomycetota bacterium]